jgi:hypothetical protein
MVCAHCRGTVKLLKLANEHHELARVLAEYGLGPRPPPRREPAPPGQLELKFAA